MLAHALPPIPGWDFSGIVDAVGERVTRVKPGDHVFSRPDIMRDGSYAEYIAVREDELAIKPATVSHIEAASLPLAGITAYQAIVAVAQVVPGQRVLVHAAAGGVGSLAVQLRPVIGAELALDRIARAHALSESGHARGKIVLYVGPP